MSAAEVFPSRMREGNSVIFAMPYNSQIALAIKKAEMLPTQHFCLVSFIFGLFVGKIRVFYSYLIHAHYMFGYLHKYNYYGW